VEQGLTGKQGVIIPKQNVRNLMLAEEVVAAVERGEFHIWEVGHIAEGIEILTGVPGGNVRGEDGHYPEGSIFAKLKARFASMYEAAKEQQERQEVAGTVQGIYFAYYRFEI
jgi:predicted ATP-dependent protease